MPKGRTWPRSDHHAAGRGHLKLDGVAVIIGQEISLADLQANKLSYQGDPNYFGLDQFAWTGSDGVAFAPDSGVLDHQPRQRQ
jgi:hypothetical protein